MSANEEIAKNVSIEDGTNREVLTEIEVSDEPPPDDDGSTIWTDADDDGLEDGIDRIDIGNLDPDRQIIEMSICKFDGHHDSVYCAAVHPKHRGIVITGGGDDKAFIWKYSALNDNVGSGEIISAFELTGHTDTVTAVGFNFDGTLALTGSYDGTVRVWQVASGELKLVLEGPEDVEWAQWHSKGNAILAGSKDGTVWMWLAHNGQCVQVFAGHDGPVSSGCFTKDGKLVCTGGDDGTVRIWAPKTGACKHIYEGHFGHEATVTCLVGSNDSDLLLSGSVDGTVKLYQISGKRVLQTFVHSRPGAAAGGGGSDRDLPAPPPPAAAAVSSAAVVRLPLATPDEGDLYDIDEGDEDADGEDGEAMLSVECVGFSDGAFRWAASGGMDQTLKVWDLVSGSCRSICMHGGSVVALSWHSTLPVVTTAALDCIVRVWDARSGSLLLELSGHSKLVTSLTMSPLLPLVEAEQQPAAAGATAAVKEAAGAGGEASVEVAAGAVAAAAESDLPAGAAAGEVAGESAGAAGIGEIKKAEGAPQSQSLTEDVATDVIISVADDKTARVYHINIPALLS